MTPPKQLHHQKDRPSMGDAPPPLHPGSPIPLVNCSTSIDEHRWDRITTEGARRLWYL